MTEIRVVWQALQKMMPHIMKRADLLKKHVRLLKPQHMKAVKNGYITTITAEIWIRLPSKKQRNPKPQRMISQIDVSDLTLDGTVDIDVNKMVQQGDTDEIVKALYLACLIELGIFTDEARRRAFQVAMKL